MRELFQFFMDKPWQAVAAAASGFAAFGATVKIIGVIIDLFGRARKRLNKRLNQLETLVNKVLSVTDSLGIDIVRSKVEDTQQRLEDALAILKDLEAMKSLMAFIETVKANWTTEQQIKYENIKGQMLVNGLYSPAIEQISQMSQYSEPITETQEDPIQPVKHGKKKKKFKVKEEK